MRRMILRLSPVVLLGCLGAGGAFAQLPTPRSEREPSPGAVREAERAAGVAPDAAARAQEGRATDQIYRDLTGTDPNAPPPATPLPGLLPGPQTPAVEQIYRDLTRPTPR